MLREEKNMLWRLSAALLGAALPAVLLGRGLTFALIGVGLLAGIFATKGESLRATVRIFRDSWVPVVVLVMLATWLLSAAWGINVAYAFEKWQQLVLVAAIATLLFFVLREMPGAYVETLLKSLAVITFLAMALAVTDALIADYRLSAALHGTKKALTPMRLNFMSSALAVILPFVWARLLVKSREGEPFALRIALPASAFSLFTLLLCGGRAGWVGGAAALVLFLWLVGRYHNVIIHFKHWVGGLLLVALSWVAYGYCFGWGFMMERVSVLNEGGRGPMSGRLDVWQSALNHVWDQPLTGIGVMNFRNLPDVIDIHPHNWAIQMLLEVGILGTLPFVVLLGMLAFNFYRYSRRNVYGAAALASLTGFLVTGLANTSIFNIWWVAFFVFTSLLGWRVGWTAEGTSIRKRGVRQIVKRRDLVADGKR